MTEQVRIIRQDTGRFILDTTVVMDYALDHYELSLYVRLCAIADNGMIDLSLSSLENYAEMSRRKLIDSLTVLANKGLIYIHSEAAGDSSNYTNVYEIRRLQGVVRQMHGGSVPDTLGVVYEMHGKDKIPNKDSNSIPELESPKDSALKNFSNFSSAESGVESQSSDPSQEVGQIPDPPVPLDPPSEPPKRGGKRKPKPKPEPKPRERDVIWDALAEQIYSGNNDDGRLPAARHGLTERYGDKVTPKSIEDFVKWFKRTKKDLSLPLVGFKVVTAFGEYLATNNGGRLTSMLPPRQSQSNDNSDFRVFTADGRQFIGMYSEIAQAAKDAGLDYDVYLSQLRAEKEKA